MPVCLRTNECVSYVEVFFKINNDLFFSSFACLWNILVQDNKTLIVSNFNAKCQIAEHDTHEIVLHKINELIATYSYLYLL